MLLRPRSINYLRSTFVNQQSNAIETSSTLTISTAIYNSGDYKAGRPAVGSYSWTDLGAGVFQVRLPSTAIGGGPNDPICVFPLTVVTTGIDALDGVTVRFEDVVQAFPRPSSS